jgi:hypothetical protein
MYTSPPFPFGWLGRLVLAAALGSAAAGPVLLASQWTIEALEGRSVAPVTLARAPPPAPRHGPAPPLTAQGAATIAWLFTAMATLFIGFVLFITLMAGGITLTLGFLPLLIAVLLLDLAARRFAWMKRRAVWIGLGVAALAPFGPGIDARVFQGSALGWPLNLLPAGIAGAVTGALAHLVMRGGRRRAI